MDCLTPDVLAAWMDGTLSVAERSAAEAHAADCAHCQAMLAAIALTAPAPPRRVWWTAPAVRWLVPVGAAALVFAVWVGVERKQPRAGTASGPSAVLHSEDRKAPAEIAVAEPPSSVASVPPARDAAAESAQMRTRTSEDAARRQGKPGAIVGDAAGQNRHDALAPKDMYAAPSPVAAPAPEPTVVPVPQASGGISSSARPPSAAAPAATPAPTPDAPTLTPLLPTQESVTTRGEAALSKKAAPLAGAAARARPVEVISPEPSYRWQSLAPGSVRYSTDGGEHWRASATGTAVVLHAGSAPSRTVCWFVGQAGTVLLTTDGLHWLTRPFPERIDLTDIRATDARNATVTMATGRRFATNDGGATWFPLQEN